MLLYYVFEWSLLKCYSLNIKFEHKIQFLLKAAAVADLKNYNY